MNNTTLYGSWHITLIAIAAISVVSVASLDQWLDAVRPSSVFAAETRNPEAAATQMSNAFRTFIKDMEDSDVLEQPPEKQKDLEERFQARLRTSLDQIVALERTSSEEEMRDLTPRYFLGISRVLDEHIKELRGRIRSEQDFMKKGRLETWVRYWGTWSSMLASAKREIHGNAHERPQEGSTEISRSPALSQKSTNSPDVKTLLHDLAHPLGRLAQAPDGEFAQHLAAAQARTGDLYGAFHTTTGIRSVQGRIQSYIRIGDACAANNDAICIETVLKQLASDDTAKKMNYPYGSLVQQGQLSVLAAIVKVQSQKGLLAQAEATFSRIDYSGMPPEVADQTQHELLRELAMAYVQRHDVKSALNAVERIKSTSRQDHTLADIAIALAEAGESDGAKRAVELLLSHKPGTHFAPRIVEVLVRIGHEEEATRFLQPLLQTALNSGNEWTIGDCVIAQAHLNPIRARQLVSALPAKTGNTSYSRRDGTFSAIAIIQVKQKDVTGAIETIALTQNPQTHDSTLQIIAEELIKAHDLPHALQAAKAIKHPYWKHTLAKVQTLLGNVSEGMHLADSLSNSFDKSQVFSSIVEAQVAMNALQDAVQTAQFIDHGNIKDRTYTDLALAHAGRGDLPIAITLVAQVMYQRQAEVYRQIGFIISSAGKWNDVWRLTQEPRKLPGKESLLLGMVQGTLDYKATH